MWYLPSPDKLSILLSSKNATTNQWLSTRCKDVDISIDPIEHYELMMPCPRTLPYTNMSYDIAPLYFPFPTRLDGTLLTLV
jgi:hypothetical protein